jgi:hypothetical protein
MSDYVYTYATILAKAKNIKNKAEKEYAKTGAKDSYYIAKAVLNPKKEIKKISFKNAPKSTGDNFGRQIKKAEYTDMAKRFVKFVESKGKLPNNIKIGEKLMRVSDYTLMFSNILISYDKNGKLPDKVNVNSKVYIKPTENKNTVFTRWVSKFKFTPKYIDDVCDYILKHFTYLFYYDDVKSNAEVIDSKSGNCTDLLQMLINMAEAMGYEWKVIHVKCNQSGVGHVYGMFRKSSVNGGKWFIRDIACIADESRYCVWCEAGNGGSKIAENPSWFLENVNR